MKRGIIAIALIASTFAAYAQESPVTIALEAEGGAVKVLYHTYQVGETGTEFDFVKNGGQEILFPFQRFVVKAGFKGGHELRFLYQPLEVATQIDAKADFTVDSSTFVAGEAVDVVYGFPFYRATYLYDFIDGAPSLSAGAAIQLRNASIRFTSVDGSERAVSQNLGIVPAVALAGELPLGNGFYAGFEATGLWASSAIINGADFEFEGSILDASLRAGAQVDERVHAFVNLRFLGGSAMGVSQYDPLYWTQSTERYTANYLATTTFTLGATLEL
ncbi:MAG: hypothetical protein JXM71_06425 [Spirochaetales bacterium]|nr:hypothetical protein [Spirochaetales bacterium]